MGMYDNPPYYLTAYSLAVKRGFVGSIDDWLASLKGNKVELRCHENKIQWRWIPDAEIGASVKEDDWKELLDVSDVHTSAEAAKGYAEEAKRATAGICYFGYRYTDAEKVIDLNEEKTVKLYLFPTAESYDAVVAGEGTIADCTEVRPDYVQKIVRLHIEDRITYIGDHFMHGAHNLKHLTFAKSQAVTHLGAYAFAQTLIGGEYDFSGLTDTRLDKAFLGCAKLEGVKLSSTIAEITGETFADCHALRYVKGLTGLKTITGQGAFYNCVCLEELEVTPANVELSNTVFVHVSNTAVVSGTGTRLLDAVWGDPGMDCFVQNMWSETDLANIRATTGASSSVPIPIYDAQTDYPDWALIWGASAAGFKHHSVASGACGFFSMYHIYNVIHPEAQYRSFREFVNNVILPRKITVTQDLLDALNESKYGRKLIEQNAGVDYSVGSKITAFDLSKDLNGGFTGDYTAFWGVCQALGWTPTKTLASDFADGKSTIKKVLIEELAANKPVSLMIHSRTADSDGGHAIAVLGYDSETDKFLVINSTSKLPAESYAVVYWNELEALISPSEYSYILTYDFGEEITMTDIDGKLGNVTQSNARIEGMIASLNNGFRVESDSFTIDNKLNTAGSTGTGMVTQVIPCSEGAKLIVLEGDYNAILAAKPSVADDLYVTISAIFNPDGLNGYSNIENHGSTGLKNGYGTTLGKDEKVYCNPFNAVRVADGYEVSVFSMLAGTYNWTAYYWDE